MKKKGFDEEGALKIIESVFDNPKPCQIALRTDQIWAIVSAIQLSITHPSLSPLMKVQLEEMGRGLQKGLIAAHPDCAELIEMGWNRGDVVEFTRH